MKCIVTFSLLLCLKVTPSEELSEARKLYMSAAIDEASCKKLLRTLENATSSKQPTLAGYKACATMIMAKYQLNPISKLNSFNDGKSLLDKCVSLDINNVELRFLRFSAQCETPSFLGYSENLDNDKELVIKAFPHLSDKELQNMISTYMRTCEQLTAQEKKVFNLSK